MPKLQRKSRVPVTTDQPAPAKGKKAKKEPTWWPVMAIRRSKRNMNDDRPVMDKAQEFKKKWSPDQHKGKKLFPPKAFDKFALVCVAKTVGLKVSSRSLAVESCLDNMENMEKVRGSSFSKSCTTCNLNGTLDVEMVQTGIGQSQNGHLDNSVLTFADEVDTSVAPNIGTAVVETKHVGNMRNYKKHVK